MSLDKQRTASLLTSHARIHAARELLRWARSAEVAKVIPTEAIDKVDDQLHAWERLLWDAARGSK